MRSAVFIFLYFTVSFFFLKALKELLSSSIDLHMQVRICLFFFLSSQSFVLPNVHLEKVGFEAK